MEEETPTGQTAEPEAPPGDAPVATAEAPPYPAEASAPEPSDGPGAMPDPADSAAMATWLDASEAWINAQATAEERDATHPMATAPDAATSETPAPTPSTEQPDRPPYPAEAIPLPDALKLLEARGYKVEAPAPPPDPYQQLVAELSTELGTNEAYAEVRQKALQYVPAEPAAYDADSVARHEALVRERNEAAATLERFDQARRLHTKALTFARDRALADVGRSFSALPETYQLSPERAQRVLEPQSATDAVAAVVETVTERLNADWQAKYEALEKRMTGEVARARADRTAENVQRMGRAPQPAAGPGGTPARGAPIWAVDPKTGLPTEESIQRAIRGDYEHVDLGR